MENSAPGWKKFGSGITILDPQQCFVPGDSSVDLYWYLTLPQVGVNLLEDGNAEGGRLAGSRLRLGDHVHSLA
jgi:hypothetical protein